MHLILQMYLWELNEKKVKLITSLFLPPTQCSWEALFWYWCHSVRLITKILSCYSFFLKQKHFYLNPPLFFPVWNTWPTSCTSYMWTEAWSVLICYITTWQIGLLEWCDSGRRCVVNSIGENCVSFYSYNDSLPCCDYLLPLWIRVPSCASQTFFAVTIKST